MPEAPIRTLARVTECRGQVCIAELKNGKTTIAHLAKCLAEAAAKPTPGDHVLLELNPYDFDTARIVAIHPNPPNSAANDAAND